MPYTPPRRFSLASNAATDVMAELARMTGLDPEELAARLAENLEAVAELIAAPPEPGPSSAPLSATERAFKERRAGLERWLRAAGVPEPKRRAVLARESARWRQGGA